MPRFFYDPIEGSDVVLPIVLGGTGASTADDAASNLGFVKSSLINAANGVTPLDNNRKVPISLLPTGANGVAILDSNGKVSSEQLPSLSGSVESAARLASSRNIASTGDVMWSVNFDGSANATAQATLSNTGVIAGSSYSKFNVDAKGRVTSATMLTASDIPTHTHTEYAAVTHTHTGITLTQLASEGAAPNQVIQWNGSRWAPGTVSATGSIDSASKLSNSRNISATGDATWLVNFDGSANATGTLTLASSGVTQGNNYTKVSVDAKGRVTSATMLTASDMPTGISLTKLASEGAAPNQVIQWNGSSWGPGTVSVSGSIDSANKLAVPHSISATGDATWTASNFNGTADVTGTLTLAPSGVTPGSYSKVNVDAKGRVTSATMLTASDIPTGISLTKLASEGAATNQVIQWNGTKWAPGTVSVSGSIDSANKLAVPHSISATGDATWTASNFNGTADVTGTLTLAPSGVIQGSNYTKFDVDAKGRVTSATMLTASDIPTGISLTKLASDGAATNQVIQWNGTKWVPGTVSVTGSIATADKLTYQRSISITGDATWSINFDGSANANSTLTLANSGVTPGSYSKVSVDGKGRVTSGSTLTSGDIPTHTHNEYSQTSHTHTLSTLGGSLQLSQIAPTAATLNQVIQWNGSGWTPATLQSSSAFDGNLNADLAFAGFSRSIRSGLGLQITGNYGSAGQTAKTFRGDGDIHTTNTGTGPYREIWKAPTGSGGTAIVGFTVTYNSASVNFSGYRSVWYDESRSGVVISSHPTASSSPFMVGDNQFIYSYTHFPWDTAVYDLGSDTKRWRQIYTSNAVSVGSDRRTKDIIGISEGLSFINKLNPVKYRLISSTYDMVDSDEIERYHEEIDTEEVSDGMQTFIKEIDGKLVEVTEEVFTTQPIIKDVNIYDVDGNILRVEKQKSFTRIPVYKKVPVPVAGKRPHYGLIAQEVKSAIDELGIDFAGWTLSDKDDPDSQQALRYDEFIAPLIQAVKELSAKVNKLEAIIVANGFDI